MRNEHRTESSKSFTVLIALSSSLRPAVPNQSRRPSGSHWRSYRDCPQTLGHCTAATHHVVFHLHIPHSFGHFRAVGV